MFTVALTRAKRLKQPQRPSADEWINNGVHTQLNIIQHQKEETSDNCHNSPRKINAVGQLIYDKGGKNIQVQKTISSTSGAEETGQLHVKQ